MSAKKPCLAIVLIPGCDPNYAASYHWCKFPTHPEGTPHVCYCGIWWLSDDMVEPTPEMVKWRTGSEPQLKEVSRRMLG